MSRQYTEVLGLHVFLTKAASRSRSIGGPNIQGEIFRSRSDRSRFLETAVADTGCSYSLCSQSIVSDLNISVIALKNSLTIVDTAGQKLDIIVPALIRFYCKVLKHHDKRVEVAILAGNPEREILLCWTVSRVGI